ncbi:MULTISPECIES: DUF305 domain-containing protein [Micromonospora]|uniref:Uncharacterized conserved protein, DUF305 family n=1 Tax=Micromonospora yangpuensis TaxID=683228 RepID=A0A1C6V7A7_9ACTN|nr:DUF305 domain-containing protein [Micromonospora yangpuensis]GGM19661.1 hypothetical protein GCM10012279_42560 [Micromonospora yangpuensis]SCL62198.1 Uncharacterized conserved protein, DUF305 family [Micromonospora yangpuensis]
MTVPVTADRDEVETPAAADGGRSTPRRFGTAVLAAAVVVGLLLGYAGGLLTPGLTRPGDNSAEAGFARDMTTHHAQAVAMGLIAYQRGTDSEVRQIGVDIALAQQGEMGTMQTWLRSWDLDPAGSQPRMAWMDGAEMVNEGLMPGMASTQDMARLETAQGRELDVLFLELMITHHMGGIHMIDGLLERSDEPDVVRTAQTMKNTQQTDLTNLRNALERLKS